MLVLCFVDVRAEAETEALADGICLVSEYSFSVFLDFIHAFIIVVILIVFPYFCALSSFLSGDRASFFSSVWR